jgi:menaquinone-9 beta-reductase
VKPVSILGGGPAGSSAAIAACREGAEVRLIERSQFPRHKVCGEFLSPAIEEALDRLSLWPAFCDLKPAVIRRMLIRIGGAEKSDNLPAPAYGLSRYSFDQWLWKTALAHGAKHGKEHHASVVTTGRASTRPRGGRLFGFKAHFVGPTDDAVELYFAGSMYVGVNCVENAITNVCGLASEEQLREFDFDVDTMIFRDAAVRARLAPLRRQWEWIFTGPLEFHQRLHRRHDLYVAGDALSFVDPFTGSGLLCAVLTGSLAGRSAARAAPVSEYVRQCSSLLKRPFGFSSVLRRLAMTRAAGPMLNLAPASLIFRLTRPSLSQP